MRPVRSTPAHQTANFAELVCSNSLKSDTENTAPWLLKEEMRRAGSLLMEIARQTAVPAGHALAVDRDRFAEAVTAAIEAEPLIHVVREEVTHHRREQRHHHRRHRAADLRRAVARDPASERQRAALLLRFHQPDRRSRFHRHVARVHGRALRQGQRRLHQLPDDAGKSTTAFSTRLLEAHSVDAKDWENLNYFESCLPIEEIARRGRDTLRFGPMKPVGLRDPRTGHMPYAVVQLRQENLRADSYNLVGFQNHLKFGEQARILRLIPGLENAKFLRYGQIHRNTYINGPTLAQRNAADEAASRTCSSPGRSPESKVTSSPSRPACWRACTPLRLRVTRAPVPPPRATAFGALVNYICHAEAKNFQPANITFDLLQPLDEATRRRIRDKKQRHAMVCERALAGIEWLACASSCDEAPSILEHAQLSVN